MRAITTSTSRVLVNVVGFHRLLLALSLLAVVAATLPDQTVEAGGRPRVTAFYDLGDSRGPRPDGTITVRGEGFAAGARVVIQVDDVSQVGLPPVRSQTLMATANGRGSFSVVTGPDWCPRVVEIRATHKRSGDRDRFTLRDSQCPW